jgi:hypothetical protein
LFSSEWLTASPMQDTDDFILFLSTLTFTILCMNQAAYYLIRTQAVNKKSDVH